MAAQLLERRTHAGTVELRAEDGGRPVAHGYALKFNKRSKPLGSFVEQVAPQAVTKTLQEADIRALWNHDVSAVLGRAGAGTLRLRSDDVGLFYEVDLPDTTVGRDVVELLRRGDVFGSSFGFRFMPGGSVWGRTEDGYPLRTLTEIALRDVGPVAFPAYDDATASLRSLAEQTGIDVRHLVELAEADELIRALDADSPAQVVRRRRYVA